jgi:xanthine/uracil/vitamin C permease (AzgA family)
MSEGEVVGELVEFTNILLAGVSLIFSIVSAYVVALNYFIGSSNFMARLGSFAFVTLILAMLMIVLMGAQATHAGLIQRLNELDAAGQLSAAGRAVLDNARPEWSGAITGRSYSIDDVVRICIWSGLGFVYLALAYLTFLHRWTPDAIPVSIEPRPAR